MAAKPRFDHVHQFIAQGQKAEARRALAAILYHDVENAQAWWMYAQVAENADQLLHILRVLAALPANPYTQQARTMLTPPPSSNELIQGLPAMMRAR
jgi:thioredoxin-like negative regulator of GroEL